MTRPPDWVDRLAGVDSIETDLDLGLGRTLTPEGKWLTWPQWRRLAHWLWRQVQWRFFGTLWAIWSLRHWRRWGQHDERYHYLGFRDSFELAQGYYDIDLWWRVSRYGGVDVPV